MACGALADMIGRAAACAGMVAQPRTVPRPLTPAGRRRPAWFDEQCRETKRRLRWAVKWGHARDQLIREYKRVTCNAKRRYEEKRALRLLDMIKTKDPEAYRLVQQRAEKKTSPIMAATWRQHLEQHFGAASQAGTQQGREGRGARKTVAMDAHNRPTSVVALGRGSSLV